MKILIIAPHPDDEILGVGGTIAKYVSMGHEVYVCIVTKGCLPLFEQNGVEKVPPIPFPRRLPLRPRSAARP